MKITFQWEIFKKLKHNAGNDKTSFIQLLISLREQRKRKIYKQWKTQVEQTNGKCR